MTSGADFFVNTVVFYLIMILEFNKKNLEIKSEHTMELENQRIRPDISVWENEELHTVIECKTQLGWNRTGWRNSFEHRERIIKEKYPEADVYLPVMTSQNWSGFKSDIENEGKFFTMANL